MEKITKQQIPVLAARLVEFQGQLTLMSKKDAQWAILNSKEAIKLFIEAVQNRTKEDVCNSVLSLVPPEKLAIESLPAGEKTIAQAKETFAYIDSNFKNWGLDRRQLASEETPVDVYELKKNITFQEMFNSLDSELDKFCLTQSQIISFCKKHKKNLASNNIATLFLFKENNEFFVAGVGVISGGLGVDVGRFGDDFVWSAGYARRLVVPATKLVA